MTSEQIVDRVRDALNEAGSQWDLKFQVSDKVQPDGAWLQVFIKSDSTQRYAAAERQIIADVESDLSESCDQELLLVSVQDLISQVGSA